MITRVTTPKSAFTMCYYATFEMFYCASNRLVMLYTQKCFLRGRWKWEEY